MKNMIGGHMSFKDDEERRAYFREYNKGWYQRHRERLLEKRRQHDEELRIWLRRYKSKLCCVMCSENHPACIQFHHRNREELHYRPDHWKKKIYNSQKARNRN